MKLITPPKLIPPFHSAAASGTLPIEQTKLMSAMNGPIRAFSMLVQMPWPETKNALQNDVGTSTASTPATRNPITISRRSMVRSATV
jgi:hypothetical protein